MSNTEGFKLSQGIRRKVEEMKNLCAGVDEKTAARAPSGRWSPKEIVSHLCGPESGGGGIKIIRTILEQDTPHLDIEAGNPFYTGKRRGMTLKELLLLFERECMQTADLIAGLTAEQLGRKAHIPLLKETPFGEYPTLAEFVAAISEYHMDFHIKHMREILEALQAK
jgi:hypothetical protein